MPKVLFEVLTTDSTIQGSCHLTAEHPCFEGHFPDYKIFPAVAQLDLLLELLEQVYGREFATDSIRKAKFPAPIVPDSTLVLKLEKMESGFHWTIHSNSVLCSLGHLFLN